MSNVLSTKYVVHIIEYRYVENLVGSQGLTPLVEVHDRYVIEKKSANLRETEVFHAKLQFLHKCLTTGCHSQEKLSQQNVETIIL